jgi:hypothetical protein
MIVKFFKVAWILGDLQWFHQSFWMVVDGRDDMIFSSNFTEVALDQPRISTEEDFNLLL